MNILLGSCGRVNCGLEVPPLGSSEIVLDSRVQKSSLQSFESEGLNKPLHYADLTSSKLLLWPYADQLDQQCLKRS